MFNKNILDYFTFLNESKTDDFKIIVFTGKKKGSSTTKSFEDVCKERNIECHVIDTNNALLEKVYNGHLLIYENQRILISPETTVIIPRRGVLENSHTQRLFYQLERGRYFVVNSLESIKICENKYLTSQILEEYGLPVPKYALVTDYEFLDTAVDLVGGKFPVILKLLAGTQGIGVSIIDSYASLKSVFQTIKKVDPKSEILLQEMIESEFDIRVQTLIKNLNPIKPSDENKIVLGVMKRKKIKGDFRTNYSLGGEIEKYMITKELEKLAFDATVAVGCHWAGVDIIIDKKTNKPYILEINSSPGTEGISKVLESPITKKVVDYVTDKSNWSYYNLETGYLENIQIPGIGTFVAKFDTGNGSKSCSIHADEFEEKDGKLIWSLNGKKYVHDIVDFSKTRVGHATHERYVIELDVVFNGVVVEDVRFSPVNRDDKTTPVLLNRTFMSDLGIVVNSDKAFVLTDEPPDIDITMV